MPTIQCKVCDSTIEYRSGQRHCKCPACGAVQEIPRTLDDEEFLLVDTVLDRFDDDEPESQAIFDRFAAFEEPQGETGDQSEIARKNGIYYTALSRMGSVDAEPYRIALEGFSKIPGWKDADALREECLQKIEAIETEERLTREAAEKRRRENKILIGVTIPIVSLLLIFSLVLILHIIPNGKYQKALAAAESGNTIAAYEGFNSIKSYKDSAERAEELFPAYKEELLKVAKAGDTVYFGSYEQDNIESDGKEEIEWKVLDKKGNRLLLLSNYGLDSHPFHDTPAAVTWETCELRQWLNKDFAEEAFTQEQLSRIVLTDVEAHPNPDFEVNPGNDTRDKVFLLSVREAEHYLPSAQSRRCVPTAYSLAKGSNTGTKTYNGVKTSSWILRTPGYDLTFITYVQQGGAVRHLGTSLSAKTGTIRPAIWLEINE